MSSPPVEAAPARPGVVRRAFGFLAFTVSLLAVLRLADSYLNHPDIPRPHDFLQVWSAGTLILAGENPYDAEAMFALQLANRAPSDYASMMWVPPWGLVVAMPIGALPINLAQVVWVGGQLGLILLSSIILWRLYGGSAERWWVPLVLACASGPVWWQTVGGQYAGVLLFGLTGFLAAHRGNRPVLAGLFATLVAIKPHLFTLLAVGLLIDAVRTSYGRRVVLGGILGLGIGSLAATLANPDIWNQYITATTAPRSEFAPGLSDWFNPTVQAWVRFALPSKPFWVQCVPAIVGMIAFAVYWWKHGHPRRWLEVMTWVMPVCLLIAPYGSWPCDLTLLLVPIVALAVRLDEREWVFPRRRLVTIIYIAANVGMLLMILGKPKLEYYVWVAPVLIGCLLWVGLKARSEPE